MGRICRDDDGRLRNDDSNDDDEDDDDDSSLLALEALPTATVLAKLARDRSKKLCIFQY